LSQRRHDSFEKIGADGAFDVIVVGGGINGIGVFRELALQGLRVLLVERNDFASGCSAAPSRMIHGGLRYLENGEFSLVRESLRERDALLANAPHMVRPLPTTVPITSIFSGLLNGAASFFGLTTPPSARGAVPIKIGLALYDWTTRKRRVLPTHRFRNARQTLAQWPQLTQHLRYSATYYDAWISYPERLALEVLLDAERLAPSSMALNYAELVQQGEGYALLDKLTGSRLPVAAKTIVNATGAWLDEALVSLGAVEPGKQPFVSGTKGSHIVLDSPELFDALGGHMIFFENEDGRVCIVFPYLGKVLAGATDIRVEKAERVSCTDEERDYILGALRGIFPAIALGADQIIFSFSGIRPLPRSDHEFTGRISRGHFVHRVDGPVPQFCMVGGKWTTFRAFAEQTADAVLQALGRPRVADTLGLPIGGGADFPKMPAELEAQMVSGRDVSQERAARLVDLYGTRADAVLAFCAGRSDDTPLDDGTTLTAAELVYLITHEHVADLADLVLRRLPLAITGAVSAERIATMAAIAAAELGWDAAATAAQVVKLKDELQSYHGVSAGMLAQRNQAGRQPCA
jgi:glycerol-3-phosphate dehydrogenase